MQYRKGFIGGVSKISSNGVDVKNEWGRGGVKYKEGDRISLPTVDPDINEYKTYTVTWLKIIMMTLGWCRLVIKT